MWTEKCKSITNIYQIAIKKYTCALTERLVLSSVKRTHIHQEYSSNESLKLIQLILGGGYFGHAVIYKTQRSQH